jgi:hypothetical protein
MKHIDRNTSPYEVMPGGNQWVLRGNGHVYGATQEGRLRVYLRSYNADVAFYVPDDFLLFIDSRAFNYSVTTSRHVMDFVRWVSRTNGVQVLNFVTSDHKRLEAVKRACNIYDE